MGNFTVVFDACVLYPAPLRSFLMYLALTDMFRAKWTAEIHEEWMQNVEKDYPDIPRKQLERVRDLMDDHVRDCLVTDYENLIECLSLPDPDEFISHLFDLSPSEVCKAAQQQRASLKSPEMTAEEFLDSLEKQGLASIVASLRDYEHLI